MVAGETGHDRQVGALRVHRQPAHEEILLHTVPENAHGARRAAVRTFEGEPHPTAYASASGRLVRLLYSLIVLGHWVTIRPEAAR